MEIGDSVIYQALENEVVLLDLENQKYFGLDSVGARMWELLLEGNEISVIADRLEGEFDVDPLVLRRDLERFVQDLIAAGLLKSGGSPASTAA